MADKQERIYNIPLRKEFMKVAPYKRAKKAVKALKEFLVRHMKVEMENVKLSKWINQEILRRGSSHPPHHIKIKVIKENEVAKAELHDLPKQAIEEIKREEERKKEAEKKKEEKKETKKEEKTEEKAEEKTGEEKEKQKILKKEVQQKSERTATQSRKAQNAPLKRMALQK